MYWAQALASQHEDEELRGHFAALANRLADNQEQIVRELVSVQGDAMDIGGFYLPDEQLAATAMRPSATLNRILEEL